MHAIKEAFDSGAAVTGSTVHIVVKEMDAGPIILQEPVQYRSQRIRWNPSKKRSIRPNTASIPTPLICLPAVN